MEGDDVQEVQADQSPPWVAATLSGGFNLPPHTYTHISLTWHIRGCSSAAMMEKKERI